MVYSAVVLDIEGTVCPIAFVKEVLFPYFVTQVSELIGSQDPNVVDLLSQFPKEKRGQALSDYILDLVSRDIKDPVLKQLQGHVWAQGYYSGKIKAPVYGDAIEYIKRCSDVYIYSSGSVKAQKLLFGHVQDPNDTQSKRIDLQPFIKGYFDINTSGKKSESQSYENILKDIGISMDNAGKVLFISDNPVELDAASSVGISTILALRPGNAPVHNIEKYRAVEDFSKL